MQLYKHGRLRHGFSNFVVARWTLSAITHAGVVFGLCLGTFGVGDGLLSVDGKSFGLYTMGTVVNGCMVAVVVSRLVMATNNWTVYHVLALAASAGMWVLFVIVTSTLSLTPDMSGVATQVFSMPVFYLLVSGRASRCLSRCLFSCC